MNIWKWKAEHEWSWELFTLTIAPRNIKPPTTYKRTVVPKNPGMYPEELIGSQDIEEAPDIEEVQDAKQ